MTNGETGIIIVKHSRKRRSVSEVGVYDAEGPPVPIPNTVVKLSSADNTWRAASREDRMTPTQTAATQQGGCFFSLDYFEEEHTKLNSVSFEAGIYLTIDVCLFQKLKCLVLSRFPRSPYKSTEFTRRNDFLHSN